MMNSDEFVRLYETINLNANLELREISNYLDLATRAFLAQKLPFLNRHKDVHASYWSSTIIDGRRVFAFPNDIKEIYDKIPKTGLFKDLEEKLKRFAIDVILEDKGKYLISRIYDKIQLEEIANEQYCNNETNVFEIDFLAKNMDKDISKSFVQYMKEHIETVQYNTFNLEQRAAHNVVYELMREFQ